MTTQDTDPGNAPDVEALQKTIHSFDELVRSCERSDDRRAARACLRLARELYEPVRDIAAEIRMAHGDLPDIHAGIAKLDQALDRS